MTRTNRESITILPICVRFDSDAGPFCFVQLWLRRPRGGSGRGFRRSLLFRLALAFANGVGGSGFGRPWLVWEACPGLAPHARACTFARPVPQWSPPGLALFVFRLRRGVSLVRARLHRCDASACLRSFDSRGLEGAVTTRQLGVRSSSSAAPPASPGMRPFSRCRRAPLRVA